MGRPREHDEATREALRAAAEELFEEQGPDAVTVRAVATRVDTTTRAVYSLFGSREGLLVDALAQRAYELLTVWVDEHPETDDPVADLTDMSVAVFRRFVIEHPALYRVAFQRVIPDFEPGPELLTARDKGLASLTRKVARLEGRLRRGVPVNQAVATFQAMCEGLANLELRGTIMRILPEDQEEESWRHAIAATLAGLTRRG